MENNEVIDGEIISHSPVPAKKDPGIPFIDAFQAIIAGKKVTKAEWNDKNIYGFVGADGHLKINLPDKLSDWILTVNDFENQNDYIILTEAN